MSAVTHYHCGRCEGTGTVDVSLYPHGIGEIVETCTHCDGTGRVDIAEAGDIPQSPARRSARRMQMTARVGWDFAAMRTARRQIAECYPDQRDNYLWRYSIARKHVLRGPRAPLPGDVA